MLADVDDHPVAAQGHLGVGVRLPLEGDEKLSAGPAGLADLELALAQATGDQAAVVREDQARRLVRRRRELAVGDQRVAAIAGLMGLKEAEAGPLAGA